MSSTDSTKLGVNNILSFNGHGGKISSGENQTFKLPNNVYVLVPFGIGVEGVEGVKGVDDSLKKTDDSFKGLDVCYTFPAPTATNLTFEEIIYGTPGKIKFTFSNGSSNTDAKWYLYKPGEIVPNVEYYSWKPDGDAASGNAQDCSKVSSDYDPFVSDLMKECLKLDNGKLNKKVCAYFVSDSTKTIKDASSGKTTSAVLTEGGNRHLKLKICGDSTTRTTTLKELAENCHNLVNFSRDFVKANNAASKTYKGYNDDNIFPKSNKTTDPIILLPFICNACSSGDKNIELGHNYTNDNSDTSLKPLSDIIGELSSGGDGSASAKPPTPTPNCTIENQGTGNAYITNITPECQEDIFKLATILDKHPVTEEEPKNMSNLVSAIGADYSINYAGENIMPAGSATLLYIGDTDLYSIKQNGPEWVVDEKSSVKIKYMIQASPAKSSDVGRDITKDTISNSVMNSLILAAKNGVETIIFPFIGGEIFYKQLKDKVDTKNKDLSDYTPYDTDQHAAVLVKGVTDFYTNLSNYGISTNPIKEIYFVTYNTDKVKEHEAIQKAHTEAINRDSSLKDVLKQSTKGNVISNAIYYSEPLHSKPNIAIVNAANTELAFGSGVSNMCYAGLGIPSEKKNNNTYQTKLNTIKTKFIEAFNAYIKNPIAAAPSPPPKPAPEKPKVAFAVVLKGLEDKLTANGDTSVNFTTLVGVNNNFLYPTDDSSVKKNLNSADPAIDVMIKGFESAETGDDKNFYLGACRSIEAAYKLDETEAGSDNDKKMRAKLLLNLRKNSLLLKVPRRWDYATMQPGEEPELTEEEVKEKYEKLQQECRELKGGYASEDAYNVAKQLIPLNEKIQNDKLEKQNTLVTEIFPVVEYKYNPVEIKKLETETKDGNLQFKRIQGQSSLNCGRAALANFFGTEDLLVKGNPLQSDIIFDLKKARPDNKIDMGSICHLYSKCAKLFNDSYNEKDDGCPDSENYSISVLGYTLQILGYNYYEHIHFKKGGAQEYDKLEESVKNNKILGYLVSFSELHWLCYQREELNTDKDSFYGINSTYEKNETTAKPLKELVDEHRKGRDYLSLYPIFGEESSNQKICTLLTLADTKDKYKKEIERSETAYKWNVLMKEICSKITEEVEYQTEENRIKIMVYLSKGSDEIISDVKKQILEQCNANSEFKKQTINKFVENVKSNFDSLNDVKLDTTSSNEYIQKEKEIYTPTGEAKIRYFYNLTNSTSYDKKTFDKDKILGHSDTGQFHNLYDRIYMEVVSMSGGSKPTHNTTTTHTTSTSKSRHNSSFKASSSKTKGKSHNRSHTQRVK